MQQLAIQQNQFNGFELVCCGRCQTTSQVSWMKKNWGARLPTLPSHDQARPSGRF